MHLTTFVKIDISFTIEICVNQMEIHMERISDCFSVVLGTFRGCGKQEFGRKSLEMWSSLENSETL